MTNKESLSLDVITPEFKPTFYFDYIYFRITKAYFKWDGRTVATAIIAIMMTQILIIINLAVLISNYFILGKR